jgi:site-specific DNA-methyltransferase (adenine-specific)
MNVIFDTERATLIHGETLATLRRFADKSFDAIITDPPYGEHVHAKLGKERRDDGHEARAELTFPPVDAALIALLAHEFVRLSKGWINIFSDFYTSHQWGNALVAAGGAWVRTGQWVKTNPMPQMTGDRPGCGAEDIVIGHAYPDTLEGRRRWDWNGGGKAALWRGPRDLTGSNQHKGTREKDENHPNRKPEWLIQSLIG